MSKKKYTIWTKLNGVGLERDANLVRSLLEGAGQDVAIEDIKNTNRREDIADIQIFLEISDNNLFYLAKKNFFIPNPEWFKGGWVPHLKRYTKILCKTKDCLRIFNNFTKKTVYTSFSSPDRFDPGVEKTQRVLHSPGRSSTKGTKEVIKLYRKSGKNLPILQVIQHRPRMLAENANVPNLRYTFRRLGEGEYLREQNKHGVHLCPSYYEGFGHYLNEAKSTGALVITVNLPPMNELIDRECGILVNPGSTTKRGYTKWGYISLPKMADALRYCEGMPKEKMLEMGARARCQYLENDAVFKERFLNAVL